MEEKDQESKDMNWYTMAKINKITSSDRPMIKIAGNSSLTSEAEWDAEVGDFQRWVVDALAIKGFVTKTPYKIVICVNVFNNHIGEMMFQEFWKFGTSELSMAKSTFKKLCAKMEEIIKDFKEKEAPNNLIHSYFRQELRKIDSEHLPKTNIPSINASLDVQYEGDWRSTLYGTKYPNRDSSGF